ncbi:DUF4401 domain-containing protein [Thiotrichales bacterium HSG1]|nr:DUF4401 domain-containing protein [Thiotrichales bacterium HSG1]
MKLTTLIEELIGKKLLPTNTQITAILQSEANPWFITALIGISAWFSVILFLIFVFASQIINDANSAILVGLVLLVATIFLHFVSKNRLFVDQLALALNLTGQILFVGGIAIVDENIVTAALVTWFLEIFIIFIYRDHILRFMSILIATMAALVLLYEFELYQGIHIIIVLLAAGASWYWLKESEHLTDKMMTWLYQPLGYGFVIALQLVLLLSILPNMSDIPNITWWYSTIGLMAILIILEVYLLNSYEIYISDPKSYAIFISTVLVSLLLYQSPGIIASIIILVLGFQRGNRVLMGLAIIFLTLFIIAFYYHLNISLLMKSVTLITSGIALLILRFGFKYLFPLQSFYNDDESQNNWLRQS